MPDGKKRVIGTFAASILLAASALVAMPASAGKPGSGGGGGEDDPWYGCTPWGPVIYGVDCCDYPDLEVPCEEQSLDDPTTRPDEEAPDSPGR